MGLVSEACKEQIRSRVPLEDLLREYNVVLTPVGRRLRALCPFHTEKTPSFYVDVERQTYHCFGCQEHGDLFRFVQRMHQVDFPQALELLARRAGVVLDNTPHGKGRGSGKTVVRLYDALELACGFYQRYLLEDPQARPAREYLTARRLDRSSWERFRIGFSPAEWDGLLNFAVRQGLSPEMLESAGLVRKREQGAGYYDYFRGRVIFPITDPQGRVIGFGARTLGDDVPKYLNSPKTALFDKSQVLYGLHQARLGIQREGRVAIVEGYTDAIMAHQSGLDFFVASLGTAFTIDNARRLGRLAPRVLLIFDGDAAGQKASERSLDLLVAENLDVRIYTVTDGKDPCDALLALGGEEFRRRIDRDSLGIFEFKWRRTADSVEARAAGPALRARALDEFLTLLSKVPNVVARKLYIREFSEKIGVPEEDIDARLKQLGRRSPRARGGTESASRCASYPAKSGSSPLSLSPDIGRAAGRGNAPERMWRETEKAFRNDEADGGGGDAWEGETEGEGLIPDRAGLGAVDSQLSDACGPSDPGRGRQRQEKLEELVLECALALPDQAGEILGQVRGDFFEEPSLRELAQAIQRQLECGGVSSSRLLQELEDTAAARALLVLESRQRDEHGGSTADYEEVWARLRRDLWRHAKLRRVAELKKLMVLERSKGETQEFLALRREYFEVLRELKKGASG